MQVLRCKQQNGWAQVPACSGGSWPSSAWTKPSPPSCGNAWVGSAMSSICSAHSACLIPSLASAAPCAWKTSGLCSLGLILYGCRGGCVYFTPVLWWSAPGTSLLRMCGWETSAAVASWTAPWSIGTSPSTRRTPRITGTRRGCRGSLHGILRRVRSLARGEISGEPWRVQTASQTQRQTFEACAQLAPID